MLLSLTRRRLLATTTTTAKPPSKPFKFFERKDRFETFKAVDDLDFDFNEKMDKATLLGKKKLLEKEKAYEKKHPAHTTSTSKINKFVAVDRGALDFNRLVCLKTNTYVDICKLMMGTEESTFDAVNCSTALLQLAKAPQKQEQTSKANSEVFSKLARVIATLPAFPARQTSNAVYGLAMGKFTFPELPQVLTKLVVGRKDWAEWEPQHLATLAWSLAKLRQDKLTAEVLQQVAKQSKLFGMRRFNTHDLSQLEFAFAKTSVLTDTEAFHLCSAITRNRGFPSFTTTNLITLFQNFILQPVPRSTSFLAALCEEIGNRTFYSSKEVSDLWACFAQCDNIQIEPEFLASTVKCVMKDIDALKPEELSRLADSITKLKIQETHKDLVEALVKRMRKKSLTVSDALLL